MPWLSSKKYGAQWIRRVVLRMHMELPVGAMRIAAGRRSSQLAGQSAQRRGEQHRGSSLAAADKEVAAADIGRVWQAAASQWHAPAKNCASKSAEYNSGRQPGTVQVPRTLCGDGAPPRPGERSSPFPLSGAPHFPAQAKRLSFRKQGAGKCGRWRGRPRPRTPSPGGRHPEGPKDLARTAAYDASPSGAKEGSRTLPR